MLQTTVNKPDGSQETNDLHKLAPHWRGLLVSGLFAIAAGIAAILLPRLAAITVEFVIGVLLILDGLVQGARAYSLRGREGFEWQLPSALVTLGVGLILLIFPLTGVLTLSLLVGAFFVISGVLKLLMGYRFRQFSGSGWLMVLGTVAVVIGGTILFRWPDIAASLVGVLVGIDLILGGTWLIALGLAARARAGARLP